MAADPKPSDPFQAGWQARQAYENHEWGPSPASSWEVAKGVWARSCGQGHYDCDAHPGATAPPECFMCHKVLNKGVCHTKNCHMKGHGDGR